MQTVIKNKNDCGTNNTAFLFKKKYVWLGII